MNKLIKIFNKTLSRIPSMQQTIPHLSKNIRQLTNISMIQQRARLLYLSQLIIRDLSELQSQKSVQIIDRFCSSYEQINYQYTSREFLLKKTIQGADVQYRLGSLFVERFDHPFFRQTLYFDQLKDAEQYVEIGVPKSFPKEIQDQFRRATVQQLLDQKNPLGIPQKSKPIQLKIRIKKDQVRCGFHLTSKLGKTKLNKIYHYPNIINPVHQKLYKIIEQNKIERQHGEQEQKFLIDPFLLDSKMQQIVYDLLKSKAHITAQEIAQMSRLTFVGGCVDRIQVMISLFEKISAYHTKKF